MPDIEPVKLSTAEDTVILNLAIGKVSKTRRVSSDTEDIQTEIDRDMLHVSVDLYDSKELNACYNFITNLKKRINKLSSPSFLRGGMYMVKHEAVEEVDSIVKKAIVDFVPLVEAFASVSEEKKLEAKGRLKGAFVDSHYPSKGEILKIFSISFNWFTLGTPGSLQRINKDIFERERNKNALMIEQAKDMTTKLLAIEAKGLADHLVEKLTPDVDGTPKRLHKRAIEKITEFLDGFSLRDMGSSKELEKHMETMREILDGVDAPALRLDETLKADVKGKFEKLIGSLDGMIDEEARYINLEEEE